MTSDDDIRELLVPYLLGELDDGERARLLEALDVDSSLRTELDELEQAGGWMLRAGAPPRTAPAALRANVLAAIPARERAAPVEEPADVVVSIASASGSRRRASRWLVPAFAVAASAACVVLAALVVDLRARLDDNDRQLAQLRASIPSSLATAASRPVSTSAALANAHGTLLRVGDTMLLVMEDVPDPGEGASWQVWSATGDGSVRNVSQWLEAGDSRIAVIDDAADVEQVMVSHEHATGPVDSPSSDAMADVHISA